MLVTFDPADAGKPIDRMLLKHVGESLASMKAHRASLCRLGRSTQVVDAEIAVLRRVVLQVEALQRGKKPLPAKQYASPAMAAYAAYLAQRQAEG